MRAREGLIGGFWQRIGALFIDAIALGAVGAIIGVCCESILVQIGDWSKLIGFGLSLAYFGIMNSHITNGQTLGKRAFNLRVVNRSKKAISLPHSLIRYSIMGIPFYLNGMQFSDDTLLKYLNYPLSFIVVGGLVSLSYLYVFNRTNRQSLHDVIVGTYVISARARARYIEPTWKPHFLMVAIIFITAGTLPAYLTDSANAPTLTTIRQAQSQLNAHPDIRHASVVSGTQTVKTENLGTHTTTYIKAEAHLYRNENNNETFAKALATTLVQAIPEARHKQNVIIALSYGYDMGIWNTWNTHSYSFDPKTLKAPQ